MPAGRVAGKAGYSTNYYNDFLLLFITFLGTRPIDAAAPPCTEVLTTPPCTAKPPPPPPPPVTTPCPTTTTTTPCITTTTPCRTTRATRRVVTTPCITTTTPCPTTTTPCVGPARTRTTKKVVQSLLYHASSKDCRSLPENTILVDRFHCRRYYKCVNQRTKRLWCSVGTWYDYEAGACRVRSSVTNCLANKN